MSDFDWNDPPSADHLVMGNNSLRCLHCGEEQPISMPCSMSVVEGLGKGFTKDHYDCDPDDPRGKARFEYSNSREWSESWDTGASSLAIYNTFAHGASSGHPDIPYDPMDFGRCYRLLKVEPKWRKGIGLMGDLYPAWKPLVDAWDELEALWEEESPTGKCPKLFERMKELRP